MAHPTRKHTRSRRDKRRANWKFRTPTTTQCQQCGKSVLPHHICASCGFYRGKQVINVDARRKKKEKKKKEGAAS